ncbi:hypothetical protein O181_047974 [Austropuccinia psidii MF-1]|uniref:Uncharacterized protein n=1 Tax=Austropuccinia psidii MF-1 TaxID=1389203 RepID=A0A9Q3DS30_9BASI|nr:hypothetical protein [Austropuccinia psidii MF-1]
MCDFWLEERCQNFHRACANVQRMTGGGVNLIACGSPEIRRCEIQKWAAVTLCCGLGAGVNQPFAYDKNASSPQDAPLSITTQTPASVQ